MSGRFPTQLDEFAWQVPHISGRFLSQLNLAGSSHLVPLSKKLPDLVVIWTWQVPHMSGRFLAQLNLVGSPHLVPLCENLPEQNCPGIITFGYPSGMFVCLFVCWLDLFAFLVSLFSLLQDFDYTLFPNFSWHLIYQFIFFGWKHARQGVIMSNLHR